MESLIARFVSSNSDVAALAALNSQRLLALSVSMLHISNLLIWA